MQILSSLKDQLITKIFLDEAGCIEQIQQVVDQVNIQKRPVLIICDHNTKKVAGDRVLSALAKAGMDASFMILEPTLGDPIPADYKIVKKIGQALLSKDAFPVAVGAGTINDLVKRAAFEVDIPYICVPTASSIDGYCSSGASLIKNSLKTTLECPPPVAVVADPLILQTAPQCMTASGYGDLFAKLASGIDWKLADYLGVESIHPVAWSLVQDDLVAWLQNPEQVFNPDSETFYNLFKGLSFSGFAMQVYKDSRPASGAEHMISHIWEMEHLSVDGVHVSHGFKVALGTVIISSLMEKLFSYAPEDIDTEAILASRQTWEQREADIKEMFPDEPLQNSILKISHSKWVEDDVLVKRLELLRLALPDLQVMFKDRLHSTAYVVEQLEKARCPVALKDLGITEERLKTTLVKAQMIRKRYTVLDVLYETGLLHKFIGELSL